MRYYIFIDSIKEGYQVNRISVNVAVSELKEESFTQDIHKIICESGIPEDKVAIEITESQTESDFIIMKHKIEELKEKGIKFYLDDFGTGYSNMERIMELPLISSSLTGLWYLRVAVI